MFTLLMYSYYSYSYGGKEGRKKIWKRKDLLFFSSTQFKGGGSKSKSLSVSPPRQVIREKE
jgi:hypothetical protein